MIFGGNQALLLNVLQALGVASARCEQTTRGKEEQIDCYDTAGQVAHNVVAIMDCIMILQTAIVGWRCQTDLNCFILTESVTNIGAVLST
jgi:hypothetical protein